MVKAWYLFKERKSKMKAYRLIIFFNIVLIGIIGVQLSQLPQLNKLQAQEDKALLQAKKSKSKVQKIVSSPINQQQDIKNATYLVSEFINQINDTAPDKYVDVLANKATLNVLNTLRQDLAPSVTFGTRPKFNTAIVLVNRVFNNDLQFAAVVKSDVQSVVYTLAFDIDQQLVTDLQRLPLKGSYENEK